MLQTLEIRKMILVTDTTGIPIAMRIQPRIAGNLARVETATSATTS